MVNFEEYFRYTEDGNLVWVVRRGQRGKVGSVAGSKKGRYMSVTLLGSSYPVHHIIWYLHHGHLPDYSKDEVIDHIDRNPFNNRIENLRLVTTSQNQQNTKVRKDSSTGVKGVTWYKPYNKWVARIKVQKKRILLGYFDSFEEAKEARLRAEIDLHPCRNQ